MLHTIFILRIFSCLGYIDIIKSGNTIISIAQTGALEKLKVLYNSL